MIQQSNYTAQCRKACAAGFLLASAVFLSVHAAEKADAAKDKTREECAEVAGGKTADLQRGAMADCTQGRTSELRASGMEGKEHATVKSCDARAKGIEESKRERFLRECHAGKK